MEYNNNTHTIKKIITVQNKNTITCSKNISRIIKTNNKIHVNGFESKSIECSRDTHVNP